MLARQPDALLLDITMDDMDGWETARRIRAHGLADLPIIMVSANAFENRSDKLLEAGAQAFVDKPVIESELLVTLQKHLQLEWVAELPAPSWGSELLQPAASLPADYAARLTRLARLGHVKGLHQALDELALDHPASRVPLSALRGLAERIDFAGLLDYLRRSQGADQDSEPDQEDTE